MPHWWKVYPLSHGETALEKERKNLPVWSVEEVWGSAGGGVRSDVSPRGPDSRDWSQRVTHSSSLLHFRLDWMASKKTWHNLGTWIKVPSHCKKKSKRTVKVIQIMVGLADFKLNNLQAILRVSSNLWLFVLLGWNRKKWALRFLANQKATRNN